MDGLTVSLICMCCILFLCCVGMFLYVGVRIRDAGRRQTDSDALVRQTQAAVQDMVSSVQTQSGVMHAQFDNMSQNFSGLQSNMDTKLMPLYRSIGELNALSGNVSELNRMFSTVKARGVWGEMQLGDILAGTMASGQYDRNVSVKKNGEAVEFAVRIPSKDDASFVYLPIDSKLPLDAYRKVIAASETGDVDVTATAQKELARRILSEAKDIRDKYLVPGVTTDFGVLFLPMESLYQEVLSFDSLFMDCQTKYHVVLSGPATITALLNSLRLGFSTLSLSKQTASVGKLLSAAKMQYDKFAEDLGKMEKAVSNLQGNLESLQKRSEMIRKKLASADSMDVLEAERYLES